jgi:hypothetical protein
LKPLLRPVHLLVVVDLNSRTAKMRRTSTPNSPPSLQAPHAQVNFFLVSEFIRRVKKIVLIQTDKTPALVPASHNA